MNIRDLNGKNVVIVGAHGREGKAMQEAVPVGEGSMIAVLGTKIEELSDSE